MKVMARLGHASCACAPFGAQAIPTASASAPICFIEFSFWLSEPDKQVPCRCANLWNRDPLASAATSHAQALQPVVGGRRSHFPLELGAERLADAALEKFGDEENRLGNVAARSEIAPHAV